jgi:hypothetical protein
MLLLSKVTFSQKKRKKNPKFDFRFIPELCFFFFKKKIFFTKGTFFDDDIPVLWPSKYFPVNLRETIISLLLHFEIMHLLNESDSITTSGLQRLFVVPCMLPEEGDLFFLSSFFFVSSFSLSLLLSFSLSFSLSFFFLLIFFLLLFFLLLV